MKQVRLLTILTAILVLLTGQAVLAVSNAGVLYLRVAAGARAAGMGEAFVSIADDASATYWNPAGLGNSPISGMLEAHSLPTDYGSITSVVTMTGQGGIETWVIAGGKLLSFDGKIWKTGREYITSSDQTLQDFLGTIIGLESEEDLQIMADNVIRANCPASAEEVNAFAAAVKKAIPDDYADREDLETGLQKLTDAYGGCLLNSERFYNLKAKLNEALKDGTVTTDELDRITYSIDQAVLRFLPGKLMVPFSAGINATMTCLGAAGKYLWVGTDNGLYRLSGQSWARFSTIHGLPSDEIITLANYDERLMIGTSQGVIQYHKGEFSSYDNVPKESVSAITFPSEQLAYASIGNVLYRYDGAGWSGSFTYKVRIDDSLDDLVERIAVYNTPSEKEYLKQKIRDFNKDNVPLAGSEEIRLDDLMRQMRETQETETAEATEAAADTAEVVEETEIQVDSTAVVEDAEAADSAMADTGEEAVDTWLVENNMIELPIGPDFPYEITSLAVDVHNILWVGTTGGLLSFDGSAWARYGYDSYSAPAADSTGAAVTVTAEDIARQYMPNDDAERVSLLAAKIDEYNELNGQPVEPGRVIYVYNRNTGSAIRSVGTIFGKVHAGTEYGLEKRSEKGWEPVGIEDLDSRQVVASYDYKGQAYYISESGVITETKGRREFVAMFAKWLPNLDLDMYYGFGSYVHHFRGLGTFGVSFVYLNYGIIEYTDEQGNSLGEGHPFELTVAASYGASLNSRVKWGITGKVIHSRLSEQGVAQERGEGIATAFAVDVGILCKITKRAQFGAAITNLGPDIHYVDAAQKDPLPRNLAIGLSYKLVDSRYNRMIVQAEINKLLVNLDNGLGWELENAIRHVGAEYWYANFIALRAGYKYDKEGEVKHLTFGSSLQYEAARFDLAYIPSSEDSPLANTLRIAFSLLF